MTKTKIKSVALALIAAVFMLNIAVIPVMAAVTDLKPTENLFVKEKVKRSADEQTVDAKDSAPVTVESTEKVFKNAIFLIQLQQKLKDANSSYQKNYEAFSEAKKRLDEVADQTSTLKEQILNFDAVIENTNSKIEAVATQIGGYEQSLLKLHEQLAIYKVAYQAQKDLLGKYVRMLYTEENQYITFESDGEISAIKLLVADNSVSDSMQTLKYLQTLEQAGQNMVKNLGKDSATLQNQQMTLETQKARLDELKAQLENEKATLVEQKLAKAQLLKITHGEEEVYRTLVTQYLQQQEDVLMEITALRNNMGFIDDKLKEMGSNATIADLQSLVDQRSKDIYKYQHLSDPNATFTWSVKPSRGLSAYFRDSSYQARFGIPHNAIDIPTPQGTPIAAARDGYVYKTKDNGMGYSYIILTHSDNFMTVYGHVSQIIAAEGQFVKAGDVIGLSGATPGTKGAGLLTTGPHLHFEILQNGVYKDPLDYLSLLPLPLDSMPSKYVNKIMQQRADATNNGTPGESGDSTIDSLPALKDEDVQKIIDESANQEAEIMRKLLEKNN
ncbi:MAG: peptidoglycan DD-metalloendopeptidase family protein [Candidatus Gracilibacteria bacterium]|jgi:murein DD-endopeptidase MepM/ murein hydrolase activator NlpD